LYLRGGRRWRGWWWATAAGTTGAWGWWWWATTTWTTGAWRGWWRATTTRTTGTWRGRWWATATRTAWAWRGRWWATTTRAARAWRGWATATRTASEKKNYVLFWWLTFKFDSHKKIKYSRWWRGGTATGSKIVMSLDSNSRNRY